MERFRQSAGAALRAEKQVRAALLDLVPVLQRPIDTVEIERLFAVLDALPRLPAEQIDVILQADRAKRGRQHQAALRVERQMVVGLGHCFTEREDVEDRKSTRLNSSHSQISYAVFCLK